MVEVAYGIGEHPDYTFGGRGDEEAFLRNLASMFSYEIQALANLRWVILQVGLSKFKQMDREEVLRFWNEEITIDAFERYHIPEGTWRGLVYEGGPFIGRLSGRCLATPEAARMMKILAEAYAERPRG